VTHPMSAYKNKKALGDFAEGHFRDALAF
jgi:hypothetical protein